MLEFNIGKRIKANNKKMWEEDLNFVCPLRNHKFLKFCLMPRG